MDSRVRRRTAVRLVCLVGLLAAGCTSSSPAPSSPPTVSDPADVPGARGLAVEIVQYRSDVVPRRVQVKVRQGDGPAVAISAVDVLLPGFEAMGVADLDSASRPGAAVDLPVPLGDVDCDEPPGPVEVVLAVGPAAAPLRLTATEPRPVTAPLHDRECRARQLLSRVPVELGDDWLPVRTPDGAAAAGSVAVGPVATGSTATLVDLDDTTLFRTTTPTPLPMTLPTTPGGATIVPVTVEARRCDAHAVAEDKQGYLFGVLVVLDGAEPVRVVLQPGDRARAVMEAALLERCGL